MQIPELLDELGIPYKEHGEHHHASFGWIQVDCPRCSPSTGSYRMGINLQWGNANCWVCGTHRLPEVLAELTGKPLAGFRQQVRRLDLDRSHRRELRGKKVTLPSGLGPLLKPHRHYLESRGYDPDQLARLWGLQGIGLHPKLPWRIFIPITYRGETVSYTTRSLNDLGTRYRTALPNEEALPARSVLFGADLARHAIVITEGPFDAMRIGPGAVATLGVSYTAEQAAKMSRYPVRVIVFDAEPAAQRQAKKLMQDLAPFPGTTHNVVLETGKDPDECDEKEIKEIRKRFLD